MVQLAVSTSELEVLIAAVGAAQRSLRPSRALPHRSIPPELMPQLRSLDGLRGRLLQLLRSSLCTAPDPTAPAFACGQERPCPLHRPLQLLEVAPVDGDGVARNLVCAECHELYSAYDDVAGEPASSCPWCGAPNGRGVPELEPADASVRLPGGAL